MPPDPPSGVIRRHKKRLRRCRSHSFPTNQLESSAFVTPPLKNPGYAPVLVFFGLKKPRKPRVTVLVHIKRCGKLKNPDTVCKSRLSRGPIYLRNGFPGNVLKMVNFEMSRRYRKSNFNPICTCTACYLYSSITHLKLL